MTKPESWKHSGISKSEAVEMLEAAVNMPGVIPRDLGRAWRMVEGGIWGMCKECHKEIPGARLKILPTATRCVSCGRKAETAIQKRPGFVPGRAYPSAMPRFR